MNIQPELTDSWLEEAKVNCDTLREVAEYIAQRAYDYALEEAARVCEGRIGGAVQSNDWWNGFKSATKQCGAAIRALKDVKE